MRRTQPAPDPRPDPRPRHRSRRRAWRAVPLTATLVLGGVAAGALGSSVLQDAAVIGGRSVATGTVDIATTPAVVTLSVSAMAPGDQVTVPVEVINRGTVERRYALESTTSEDALAAAVRFTVKAGVVDCSRGGWRATGVTLYSGPLGSAATATIVGSAAPGEQPGDRALTPGEAEALCLNVTLPPDAAAEGRSTTATFELRAEPTGDEA